MKPPRFAAMTKSARAEFERTGRCATCAELEAELADGRRLFEATDRFAVLVPFAAALPFELSILPIGHPPSFGETPDPDCAALAHIMRRTLRRLDAMLHHPSYNAVVEAVFTRGDAVESGYSHWRLNIAPRCVMRAGFERGSGIAINPSQPESDAAALRQAASE